MTRSPGATVAEDEDRKHVVTIVAKGGAPSEAVGAEVAPAVEWNRADARPGEVRSEEADLEVQAAAVARKPAASAPSV
ncbi:MAG: hypothetical protein AAF517_05625 [Planctomycetota bacterium]